MRNVKAWVLVALSVLFVGGVAAAQNIVDQGSPGNQGSWFVNGAAQTSADQAEVLVLNSASTTITQQVTGHRSVELQNLGPNAIFCALGGDAAVVNKSRRLEALGTAGNSWAFDTSEAIVIKCIAATADQVTGAGTIITEIK